MNKTRAEMHILHTLQQAVGKTAYVAVYDYCDGLAEIKSVDSKNWQVTLQWVYTSPAYDCQKLLDTDGEQTFSIYEIADAKPRQQI